MCIRDRDYIDTGRYLERIFPELNVRFISVTDNIDSMKQAYDMLLPDVYKRQPLRNTRPLNYCRCLC